MPDRRPLYYITDRAQFPGDESERRRALLAKIAEAARCGVDYIQLREKDLSTREFEKLAREAVAAVRENSQLRTENREPRTGLPTTRLLINSHIDIALAASADGVHLRSGDLSPSDVRRVLERCAAHCPPATDHFFIAASCHTPAEVGKTARDGADFVVFGPVFEKQIAPRVWPAGLDGLREACRSNAPVLALGGVTLENASACLEAGARGIAGIRIFQKSKIEDVVQALKSL